MISLSRIRPITGQIGAGLKWGDGLLNVIEPCPFYLGSVQLQVLSLELVDLIWFEP